jgi:beta-galactosidase
VATRVEWEVPYAPGELVAVGLRGAKPVVMTVVPTTGPAAAVKLQPDRGSIVSDARDAVPVRVSITDARGRVMPTANNLVRFSVSGPARIIGVGNGNPGSHEPDKADRRRAFNGLCLVILQSTGNRGTIRLTARARGLKPGRALLGAA